MNLQFLRLSASGCFGIGFEKDNSIFTALVIYLSLVSCSGNYEVCEGWPGYDKELNNLTGFQPEIRLYPEYTVFHGSGAKKT